MTREPPPQTALQAFGATGEPQPLAGGQGTSWLCDGLVLKPEGGVAYAALADALATVTPVGFRLAHPVRTVDGQWSACGWSATTWVAGAEPDLEHQESLLQIINAGRAFHRAVAHVSRPTQLDERDDPWAVADRIAWAEVAHDFCPELADTARRLQRVCEPLGDPQLMHGDLTGNVLLSSDRPPAVIDVSPYWRPAEYAEAVVVADALCWHQAQPSLLAAAGISVPAVARALLFRLATTDVVTSRGSRAVDLPGEAARYAHAAQALGL